MPGQFEVMIERNFSSAHQLRGYRGKCENLHGHNYKIEIYARGRELDNVGLLVDFVELKAAADEVVTYLDHRNINDRPPFDELQPSAENLAKYVLERVSKRVSDDRVQIYKVRCFETPTSVATYHLNYQIRPACQWSRQIRDRVSHDGHGCHDERQISAIDLVQRV